MTYQAYVFDAYGTLFDVHSVMEKLQKKFPEKSGKISEEWRVRQVRYFMIRQLINGYQPFDKITRWSLQDALNINHADYTEDDVSELMEAYENLKPFREVNSMIHSLEGNSLNIFSNGTKGMLEPLLNNNSLEKAFTMFSADEPKIYKPAPEAYAYAHNKLEIRDKESILFLSSNPWDIAGAKNYGFTTAWVNRGENKWPELGLRPDYECKNLNEIVDL
ncbi:haloacid dehalogenase type II [Thalassobacillus pellis]|uniref:haloacid dehalogenase type II n=1 Tax=Thalassobacillus pellis TaxID=748008 RepID=UPI00195F450E|nr:haloacid dehalogenase type II [Thalassobacillus pellis]MBM7551402.1 2-haloacid dehalogenase [Thalassobacillus pellis]